MSWNDSLTALSKTDSSDSIFIRLREDGQKFTGLLVGEPLHYRAPGFDPKKLVDKFLLNIYVPMIGMRVYETNVATFKLIASLREEIDLSSTLVTVKRNGRARDPKTSYAVFATGPASPATLAEAAAAQPHDLSKFVKSSSPS
jgi:hypothetical protein